MSDMPDTFTLMEVGPRDGIQIEPRSSPPRTRCGYRCVEDSGIGEIEVGSCQIQGRAADRWPTEEDG